MVRRGEGATCLTMNLPIYSTEIVNLVTNNHLHNFIQTLTSEARILYPRACGVQGSQPRWVEWGAPHQKKNSDFSKFLNSSQVLNALQG